MPSPPTAPAIDLLVAAAANPGDRRRLALAQATTSDEGAGSVADAQRLHAARPDARLVVIPEANHVLKRVAERTMEGQMGTYRDPTPASARQRWPLCFS